MTNGLRAAVWRSQAGLIIPAIVLPEDGLCPAAVGTPSAFTRQIVCTCLLQKLHVKLTELDKVLVALNQPQGIGNSPRLDSLYWNVMRWLNYTYVCLALGLLGFAWGTACLPCLSSLMWGNRKRREVKALSSGWSLG